MLRQLLAHIPSFLELTALIVPVTLVAIYPQPVIF